MTQSPMHGMRLASLVYIVAFLGTMLLSAGLVGFLGSYSQQVTDRALDRAIHVRVRSAGLDFARSIDSDWQELRHMAVDVPSLPPETLRNVFNGMVGSGQRVAWVGFAGIDGKVIAASHGLLEGMDVSERPWYRAGLKGAYAGDVRDAVLLNRLLGGTDEDPVQFIDLAVPVTGAGGTTVGVLSAHINAEWAESYLAESAKIRAIDLFLVNAAGKVVIATADAPAAPQALQIFRAAASGIATTEREIWPDGKLYQSSIVPEVTYGDLPSFGWRLVGRVPADSFASDRSDLLRVALVLMLGCFSLVLLGAALFARLFVVPISRLAEAAQSISREEDVYPPETRSSCEGAMLSAALVRLQSMVGNKGGKG